MSQTAVAPIARTASITSTHSGAVVHLVYDGTNAPRDVLAELSRAGWRDARPCPPPKEAIDWNTPDDTTGKRYSLRPFRAVTTAVYDGGGEHRVDAVRRATALLARAGLLGSPADEPPVHEPPVHEPPVHEPPVPALLDEVQARRSADARTATLELVVNDTMAPSIRLRIAPFGSIVDDRPDVLVTATTFRGNRSETMTAIVRIQLAVESARYDELLSELSALPIIAISPV